MVVVSVIFDSSKTGNILEIIRNGPMVLSAGEWSGLSVQSTWF